MAKIYVASSWRNAFQPKVVEALREAGHEVYDFRNPCAGNTGFHWSEIDGNWEGWTPEEYRAVLDHPIAEAGFKSDFDAMAWADVFVGVQPFGRSASLEMGWAAGHGKKTILLLDDGEPELMVKMLDYICCDISEVLSHLVESVSNEFSEPIEGGVDAISPTMSSADCVKVWLSLREERLSLSVGAPGGLPAMEAKLYANLTDRLYLESQNVVFVDVDLTEGHQPEEVVMKR